MKKKSIAAVLAVAVITGAMFIPSVQAATVSALSIFRVSDTKTITISMTDIQDLSANAKQFGIVEKQKKPAAESKDLSKQSGDVVKSIIKPLDNAKDFTAFPISLPGNMNSEVPKLYSIASHSEAYTLNTKQVNAELAKMKVAPISDTYNGTKIDVVTPPAVIASYPDVTLLETQGVYINAPSSVVNSLWSDFTSLPMIPSDISSQLVAIDPTSRDVYLPVIEGLGRETDLGVTTGYIYSAKDIAQLASSIPNLANVTELTKLQSVNTSVLIWTKNGVLYALAGNKSDSELSQIARNIR
jgi:hypothetical protein